MAKLEQELAAVRAQLADNPQGDWQKLHSLADKESDLASRLDRRIAEWERATAELAKPKARDR